MVSIPIPAKKNTTPKERVRLSEDNLRRVDWSPRPIDRATMEVVPVPNPQAIPIRTMTTGKVKLMAASSLVPSRDTK